MTDDTQPLGRHAERPEDLQPPPTLQTGQRQAHGEPVYQWPQNVPPPPQRSRFWVWWNYGRKWPWVVAFFVLLFIYVPPPSGSTCQPSDIGGSSTPAEESSSAPPR